ncbi:MAG TPA: trypsin-like peptidase domain-containing protein [Steroidobacteraceae bacterium]|nr:trypsin-like peptidase domain-containing protein [Steroidobacteraceae bacterium]
MRRNLIFLAASVLAGLALALLVMRVWPQLIHKAPPAVARAIAAAPSPRMAEPVTHGETATGQPAVTGALAEAGSDSFAAAVRASAPAVVSIYTRRVENMALEQLLGSPPQGNLGSGVIVDDVGHIVTNYHVVSGSVEIAVQLADGRTAAAKLVGSDPDTDLAVLHVDLPKLPVMKLGRSDRVAVGDIVLAIGNPFGRLAQTVTHGIVSATGRADLGVATYEDFIQTDAAINEGNSGGALVDTRGELIGINTAVLGKDQGAEGLGVAIPVDLVRGVMSEILRHGRVIRGWIGVAPADVSAGAARAYGLPHAGVAINLYRDSPAAAAGLMLGDMIQTIDGQQVKSAQDVRARIAGHRPGSNLRLGVDRGTRRLQVDVTAIEAPRRGPSQ